MESIFGYPLPFTNPVLIFTLVLLIILIAPILFKKLRIPGIIGLILSGVAVGPHGLNFLSKTDSIKILGTVGLLYIMFLAGLEVDMRQFKKNKNRSITFGILTFTLPLIFGFLIGTFFLKLPFLSSLLIACMFATQTLLAYPIASKLGLAKHEAVTITIGGTIITDTIVLLLLDVISAASRGGLNAMFWVKQGLSFGIFVFLVLWGIPRLSRWFLKNYTSESGLQYIFILTLVLGAGLLAQSAGIEPIVGAFFAGLALNGIIPYTSPLMNRIEFIGNTLFIPFFLINVGMLVDLKVLFSGWIPISIAFVLIIGDFMGKYFAAFITQKIFRYTVDERHLILGLSSAHAAAAIAVVLVGYESKLVDLNILNAAVLIILVSCLSSSFITEWASRRLALSESYEKPDSNQFVEKILVAVSENDNIDMMMDFAMLIKSSKTKEPIYPLTVISEEDKTKETITKFQKKMTRVTEHASSVEISLELSIRIDLNIANGIVRAINEMMATKVILGWSPKTTTDFIFGSTLDNLLPKTNQMIIVTKIINPLMSFKNVYILVPPHAELEVGFQGWFVVISQIAKQITGNTFFLARTTSIKLMRSLNIKLKAYVDPIYRTFREWNDLAALQQEISVNDLIVVISARADSISHHNFLTNVPKQLDKSFENYSFFIIYPEQTNVQTYMTLQLERDLILPFPRAIQKVAKKGDLVKQNLKETSESKVIIPE